MSRKREKPSYTSRHVPYSVPKRRRPLPPPAEDDVVSAKLPTAVVVTGLSQDCSVLDLKSRFEIYGPISRSRMEPTGVAHITFRSNDSAQSAIAASLDPSFGITLNSIPVQVMWATDPVPQRNVGNSSLSRLLRAELPLSRHGRGNHKLGSAIVNPRAVENVVAKNGDDHDDDDDDDEKKNNGGGSEDVAYKGRAIVAYDDIL